MSLLSGNGDGTFRAPVDMIKGEGELVARSDLNMDGIPDLVFASGPYGATVSVLLGRNDSTFASPMRFGTPPGARAVAIGDFNCDGRPDLAVACTDLTTVLLNTGGTVPPPRGPASLILTPGEASLELSWLPAKCQRISGYRIYYAMIGRTCVLLLCGGDKKRQTSDIRRTREYLKDYWERSRETKND